MAGVTVEQIRKSYAGRDVLTAIDLDMKEGELVCLLGPSGCGKTTLLRIIAGFVRADSGRVVVDGHDITRLPPAARRMGMVFQAYSLFPNMTALDNVRFGPRVAGAARPEQIRRATELLDLVGLAEHRDKYPRQLSGGQQQRVALARALAVQPQVLLLDEPLSALDAQVRGQLRQEIRRIQRQTGVTTVLVTHDQEEALSIADRVAVMNGGQLLQVATPAEIYHHPTDGFVARFIGTTAVLPGIAGPDGVRCGPFDLPALRAAACPAGAAVELFLRPENVRVTAPQAPVPPGALAARVEEATFLGSLTRLRLAAADATLWADIASTEAGAFPPGSPVLASWDISAPRVLPRAAGKPASTSLS